MKIQLTESNSLPIGKVCKNQNVIHASSHFTIGISFQRILKSVLVLFIIFSCFSADAHVPPAANIGGPLRAYVNGSNIVVTSEIFGDAAPVISYSFVNNTSGASIVSQGAFQYNKSTGIGTQTIVVNPGVAKGSFRISVHVTTPGGAAESSKSVTVINADVMNNNSLNQLGGQ